MSLPVELRSAAADDIQQGRRYYEDRLAGLGDRFVREVTKVLTRISDMPELYGVVARGVRAEGVKRFAYVVYYRVKPMHVEIIAVLDGGRSPRVWKSRL